MIYKIFALLAVSSGMLLERLRNAKTPVRIRVVKVAYPGYAKILQSWDFQENYTKS